MSDSDISLKQRIKQAGPIRVLLVILSILTIILKPDNGATVSLEGFQIISTLVLPVMAPLLVTGHLLDALMGKIYASEQDDATKEKFRFIIRIDLIIAVILLLVWVPYMLSLG